MDISMQSNSIQSKPTQRFERSQLFFVLCGHRVAKCHGYGGYIRVKKLASWVKSLEEYTVLQKQVLFWIDLINWYDVFKQDYMIEFSALVPQK